MLSYIHIQALPPWSGFNSYLNLCIYLPLSASYGQGRIQPYIIVRCHWYNPFVSYSIAEVSIPWQSRPEDLWIKNAWLSIDKNMLNFIFWMTATDGLKKGATNLRAFDMTWSKQKKGIDHKQSFSTPKQRKEKLKVSLKKKLKLQSFLKDL